MDFYEIQTIEDRWQDPNAEYFKVRTTEGHLYILRYDLDEDAWTLQSGFDGDALLTRPGIQVITGVENRNQRDMMSLWMSEISTRSVPNRSRQNTHVHDASEAISTRYAGYDGRRKTACRREPTSATARFTPN
jgi:hypothetical protein